jgi:hypothetical protein
VKRFGICAALGHLALVAGPFMGLHLSWPRPGPRAVRLLTWNVWFGAGDAAAVEATVREAGAGIYLFQAAASEPDAAVDAPFGRLEVISVHPHSPRELLEPRHGGLSRLLHDPEGPRRIARRSSIALKLQNPKAHHEVAKSRRFFWLMPGSCTGAQFGTKPK